MEQSYRINEKGRFEIKLPVYYQNNQFGNNKSLVLSRLLAIGNKCNHETELVISFFKDSGKSTKN